MHNAAERDLFVPCPGKCERGGAAVTHAKGNAAECEHAAVTDTCYRGLTETKSNSCRGETHTDTTDPLDTGTCPPKPDKVARARLITWELRPF